MSLNDTMTALMDKARKLTGLTDKIGITRLTGLIDHFKLIINENLIPDAATFGNNTWQNKQYWKVEPDWNGLKVRSSEATYSGLTPEIEVQANEIYTFSVYAKQDKDNPLCTMHLGYGSEDYSSFLDNQSKVVDVGTDFKRYSMTFKVKKKCSIFPRIEQSMIGNRIYIAGYKLEVGDLATPLEKVGGVAKALLCALLPVRGCAA